VPRISAGSALGAAGIGVALLVGVDLAWLAAHSSAHNVTWWWPTNWMILPLAATAIPLLLLGASVLVNGTRPPRPSGQGDVYNQISGGTQHGNVYQGRDFYGPITGHPQKPPSGSDAPPSS
jgi:hypothetical protein